MVDPPSSGLGCHLGRARQHWRRRAGAEAVYTLLAMLIIASRAAPAQVVPAATLPGGLPVSANFHYAFRYAHAADFGSGFNRQTTTPSVSLSYASGSKRHPFSMSYGGGYTWRLSGPEYSSGLFQHLLLSQSVVWRKWSATANSDTSYRPQSAVTGFSGIPGTGEPIGDPRQSPSFGQSVITLKSHVLDNMVNGEIQYAFKRGSSVAVAGESEMLRYPDGDGLDTNIRLAEGGVSYPLDARDVFTGKCRYSQFAYPSYGFSFTTTSALFGVARMWSRKVSMGIVAGPEWTGSSNAKSVPSSIGIAVKAKLDYRFRFDSYGLAYTRSTEGGAGYLVGSRADGVDGSFSRQFGTSLSIGLEAAYRRTAGLQSNGVIIGKYGGAQAERRLGRYLSVFANYTAMDQSSSAKLPSTVLTQLTHVVGFGIEYSPRETHIRP